MWVGFLGALVVVFLLAQLADFDIADAESQENSSRRHRSVARQFRADAEKSLALGLRSKLRRDIPNANPRVHHVILRFRQPQRNFADTSGSVDVAGNIRNLDFANVMFDR